MPDPQFIQLPFGPGLDKETGVMVVRPNTMQDLRNVYHHEGSIVVRDGTEKTNEFFDGTVAEGGTGNAATHILAGIAIRSERAGIVVSWYEPEQRVSIWRVNALGEESVFLGFWPFDLDPDGVSNRDDIWPTFSDEPPKIILTEMYGQVFFAHDVRDTFLRAITYVYDPWGLKEDSDRLAPLVANFLGEDEVIHFRGVVRHLHYLFGWGWGDSGEDGVRPELLRVSLPGEPTAFDVNHYFIAGDRRDPIIACEPARQTLLVCKETETYQVIGYSRANFGIRPYDQLYGCLASRLITSVAGTIYTWSAEGPMVGGDVGPFEKIWLPLDLGGFEPASLVARVDFKDGWADYIDEVELVVFCFGRRVYVLSVRNPADPRWTYWELGKKAFCGFRLYGGEGLGGPPVSAPTNLSFAYEVEGCGERASYTLTVDNDQQTDQDRIQVWHQPTGPVWEDNILNDPLNIITPGTGTPVNWGWDFVEVGGGSHNHFWDGAKNAYFLGNFNGTGELVTGDYNELYWTTPAVTVGQRYRFEVDIYTPAGDNNVFNQGSVWIEIQFYDVGDSPVGGTNARVVRHPNYARAFTIGTAPALATYARVAVHVHCRALGRQASVFFRNPYWREEDAALGTWVVAADPMRAGPQDSVTLDPVKVSEPGMDYNVAVRYIGLGLTPSPGYEDPDPAAWPAASRGVAAVPMDAPDWLGFYGTPPDLAAGRFSERPDSGPFFEMTPGCDPAGGVGVSPLKYLNRDLEVYEDNAFIGYLHRGDPTWYRWLHANDLDQSYEYKMRYLGPDQDSPFGSVLTLNPTSSTLCKPTISELRVEIGFAYYFIVARCEMWWDCLGDGSDDCSVGIIVQDNYDPSGAGGTLPPGEWNTVWVSQITSAGALIAPLDHLIQHDKKIATLTIDVRAQQFYDDDFPQGSTDPENTYVPPLVGPWSDTVQVTFS